MNWSYTSSIIFVIACRSDSLHGNVVDVDAAVLAAGDDLGLHPGPLLQPAGDELRPNTPIDPVIVPGSA